ncbi:O-methyltransferase-domain-containing protein [Xylariomycetidae sp. FL0641]|nr:O-methyltransferase-domain-containing protein [Xylariomycetidae sp. FL0641]
MPSARSSPRIVELATAIHENVEKLNALLEARGIESPSFDEDAPTSLPEEAAGLQSFVMESSLELLDLLSMPMGLLMRKTARNNMIPFQAISELGIADMVPPGGQISFREIASKTGMAESTIRRLLRYAMTMRVFREPEPGMVAHTSASKALTNKDTSAWLKLTSSDLCLTAAKTFEALQHWPNSQEVTETAFSLAHNTDLPMYQFFETHPDRATSFGGFMGAVQSSPTFKLSHTIDNYDWASLGKAQVVDMGGSRGNVAVRLTQQFPELNVVVQDLHSVIEGAENDIPEDVKDRVKFVAHDIFTPQTVEADVYHLRWILHNWPDKYWGLIPMLNNDTRILVIETCLPEPGVVPVWREEQLRSADMSMMSLFNSQDRTVNEWETLFSQADRRFKLESVTQPQGSALAILDVRWNAKG